MPEAAKVNRLNIAEYLEGELRSPVKHEYVDGRVFAMTGVSRRHNLISINLVGLFRTHLRGGPCAVFMSDMKVRVDVAGAFYYPYYPDVVIARDPADREPYFVRRPVLIVEMLSPSTATTDRREKLLAYQRIESLREYLLVETEEEQITLYRRDARGEWWESRHGAGETLRLESIALDMPVVAAYEAAA